MKDITLSLDDFNEWKHARTLSQEALQSRAADALRRGEGVTVLDRWQWKRWLRGELCPWRVPGVTYKRIRHTPAFYPVLPR